MFLTSNMFEFRAQKKIYIYFSKIYKNLKTTQNCQKINTFKVKLFILFNSPITESERYFQWIYYIFSKITTEINPVQF